jgi:hypothetical protein
MRRMHELSAVPESDEASPNNEAVDQLLQLVQGFMEDERTRGRTLSTTAATFAGFSGTTLALTATVGARLFDRDLGEVEPAARGLFVLAVTMLAVGAAVAVVGVLRPQPVLDISTDELRRFPEFPLVATSKLDIQGRMLATMVNILLRERQDNTKKAKVTRVAVAALVAGYAAVVAMALLVATTGPAASGSL